MSHVVSCVFSEFNWRLNMFTPRNARVRKFALALIILPAITSFAFAQPKRPVGRKPADAPTPPSGPKPATMQGALDEKLKFVVDKTSKRNAVSFISKTSVETINGKTKDITGEITLNPAKLDSIEGKFTVPWKSLDTGKPRMNEHMMTSPWVNAEAHPDIVFTITKMEDLKAVGKTGKSVSAKFVGKFAMNGEERDASIPVKMTWFGSPKDKEGLGLQSVKGKFKINLSDYKIVGRDVGKKVAATLEIDVSVVVRRADTMEEDDGEEEPKPDKGMVGRPSKPKPSPNS